MNIHLYTLNKILNDFLLNSSIVLVISNTSIKNNITTSILHICFNKNIIAKTHYHIINVTFTKVELFLIRYKINQAIEVSNAKNITIIIDVIYTARHIFNSSSYSYQLHFIAIFQDLRTFFNKSSNNSIVFWNCFSSTKCPLDLAVDKETKKFKMNLITPCKLSWDFSKKEECDLILCNYQITFQVSEYKRKNFLNLIDDDNLIIRPTYMKSSLQLKTFGHSNKLCAHVIRAIINHVFIGKYCLRFFSRKPFVCSYKEYSIELRNHILYNFKRYNKYWNSSRKYFVTFLEFNLKCFFFHEKIT